MVETKLTHDRSQAGFTLVELAIVMIIIGLLIGGILKGQELINNAQVTSTASQIKAIEAAMTTFRDSYNATPGDMVNPLQRLPNCAALPCSAVGDGNGRIAQAPGIIQAAGTEATRFWTHLAAADLIGGVDSTSAVVATWGGQLPSTEIGGGFTIGYAANAAALTGTIAANATQGHYLALTLLPSGTAADVGNEALSPTQAARIDRKLDDGVPGAGGVMGAEGTAGACGTALLYAEATGGVACNLYARIQ